MGQFFSRLLARLLGRQTEAQSNAGDAAVEVKAVSDAVPVVSRTGMAVKAIKNSAVYAHAELPDTPLMSLEDVTLVNWLSQDVCQHEFVAEGPPQADATVNYRCRHCGMTKTMEPDWFVSPFLAQPRPVVLPTDNVVSLEDWRKSRRSGSSRRGTPATPTE